MEQYKTTKAYELLLQFNMKLIEYGIVSDGGLTQKHK